jgi:hypothetical protein
MSGGIPPTTHHMKGNTMNDVSKLTHALVGVAQGYPMPDLTPTIGEQLTELCQPGQAIAFRTESGSLYEMSIYSTGTTTLIKVDEETDGIREVAKGRLNGTHDRNRGVYGVMITEPDGREYKTSAVVKVWLSYDAINQRSYQEQGA